ncbi:hypothetical protein SAMN06265360_107189 [Haloechinothrix alba]|uniref:Uncharacterized protein n=1 Tax=Haloechinothrix alba TaxID=664784 RepID=A0A238WTF9_9PSEU|nr:hypothetical protein SAMN06265360_107189 [Haloechinothrix alba]
MTPLFLTALLLLTAAITVRAVAWNESRKERRHD